MLIHSLIPLIIQVRRQQLYNLQQMPPQLHPPPQPHPPPATAPSLQPISNDQYLLPPSYDDMYGGGAVGGGFDNDTVLENADWYQAGLPRSVINSYHI